jgi:hypothetical protein
MEKAEKSLPLLSLKAVKEVVNLISLPINID